MEGHIKAEVASVVAAGAAVWRRGPDGVEVCVVHRPKRDDWTIPKGKLSEGEHILACAVREVAEETGHRVALGRPLPTANYTVNGEPKTVYYWAAEADAHAPERAADHEVDTVRFIPIGDAFGTLSYEHDRRLISALMAQPPERLRTSPTVIVRHANAVPRSDWSGDDDLRPLEASGHDQATRLAASLAALGVTMCISSPAVRCIDTVRPWADERDSAIQLDRNLAEDGFSREGLRKVTKQLRDVPAVVCSHRPVLPHLLAAFGVAEGIGLRVGEFIVAHRLGDEVIATERHGA